MVWDDKVIKRILIIALLLVFLAVPITALASDISGALWYGLITISNNSTANTSVATTANISTENFIAGNFLNSYANNTVMRNSSGADVAFMPGFTDANLWCMWVPTIGADSYLTYILYTHNSTGGKIRYFPAAGGMETADSGTIELSYNFTVEQKGWVDTTAINSTLINKEVAFRIYIGSSGNITADIFNTPTQITQLLQDGSGALNNNVKRMGQSKLNFPTSIITEVQFYLAKTNNPTGTANMSIRDYSTDALIGTIGSLDVSTLGAGLAWTTFSGANIELTSPSTIRFSLEYQDGDAVNAVNVGRKNADVVSGNFTDYQAGTWTDDANKDVCYKITYSTVNTSVSATGISSGEHTVRVTAIPGSSGTFYSEVGDGVIYGYDLVATGWPTLRARDDIADAENYVIVDTANNTFATYARKRGAPENDYSLLRGYFIFDASSIPDATNISSANFSVNVTAKQEQAGAGSGIDLVRTQQVSSSNLSSLDWNRESVRHVVFPTGRETAGVFWDIANNTAYRLGGEDSVEVPTVEIYSLDTATYDIQTESETLPLSLGQLSDSVIWDSVNRYAYIYGGKKTQGPITQTPIIHRYSPDTDTVIATGVNLTQALGLTSAVLTTGGDVYIFGGITNGNAITVDTIQKHDLTAGNITTLAETLPTALCNMSSAYDSTNNIIYLYGGFKRNGGTTNYDKIYEFDVATETITTLPETLPVALDSQTSFFRNGNVYLFGGFFNAPNTYYDTILRHNISTGNVTTETDTIGKRMDDFTAVYDSTSDMGWLLPMQPSGAGDNQVILQKYIEEITFSGTNCTTNYLTLGGTPPNYETGAPRKTIAAITLNQYNTWSLNATGISWIDKTGFTKLGLLIDIDTDNTSPTINGNASYINVNYAEEGNTPPKLQVTWGGEFSIYVDGVLKDSTTPTSVPDNSENWTYYENMCAYWEYTKITVNGTLQQHIEWEYSDNFTDLSGKGHNAIPTFRAASCDPDVSANMTAFLPVVEAKAPDYALGTAPPFIDPGPNITGNFTTTPPTGGFPLAGVIVAIANATSIPPQLPLLIIATFIILAASLSTSAILRKSGSGSIVVKIITIVAFLGIFIALKNFGIDFWMLIVFAIISCALAMASRHYGWS